MNMQNAVYRTPRFSAFLNCGMQVCRLIEFLTFTSLPFDESFFDGMCELFDAIFTGQSSNTVAMEFAKKPNCLVLLAIDNERVFGYKIGCEERTARLYSWLGGVNPPTEGKGLPWN
jgi:hypothetical protein